MPQYSFLYRINLQLTFPSFFHYDDDNYGDGGDGAFYGGYSLLTGILIFIILYLFILGCYSSIFLSINSINSTHDETSLFILFIPYFFDDLSNHSVYFLAI